MSEKYQIIDLGGKGWELFIANDVASQLATGLSYDDAADVMNELNTLAAENARLREALMAHQLRTNLEFAPPGTATRIATSRYRDFLTKLGWDGKQDADNFLMRHRTALLNTQT